MPSTSSGAVVAADAGRGDTDVLAMTKAAERPESTDRRSIGAELLLAALQGMGFFDTGGASASGTNPDTTTKQMPPSNNIASVIFNLIVASGS